MSYKLSDRLKSIAGSNDFVYDINSSLFVSTVILGISSLTLLARVGFDTPISTFFVITGLSLLFANGPLLLKPFFNYRGVGIDAVYLVMLFTLVVVVSFLPPTLIFFFRYLFAIAGFYSFLLLLRNSEETPFISKALNWFVIPIMLLFSIVGYIYKIEIHHPLYVEKISMGIANMDNLYHASISAMLTTYGIPSTGLYGTPFLHYHFGSHLVLSRFSIVLDIPALEAYNYLFPILFLPLYLRASLILSKDLFSFVYGPNSLLRTGTTFWVGFAILNMNFLPFDFQKGLMLLDGWIVSESYSFSLFFLFLFISLTLFFARKEASRVLVIIVVPLLVIVFILMGLSKISTLLVALSAIIYLAFRSGKWKDRLLGPLLIALVGMSYFILKLVNPTNEGQINEIFSPLHSINTFIFGNWRNVFVFAYYFFLIVYIIGRLTGLKSFNTDALLKLVREKKILDIEFLLVIAIAGFVPPALLAIEGGSGFYFMDIQYKLVIVFFAFLLLAGNQPEGKSFREFLGRNSILVTFIFFLCLSTTYTRFEDYLNINLRLRTTMINEDPGSAKFYAPGKNIYGYLAGNPKQVVEKIKEIAYLPGKAMYQTSAARGKFGFYKWLADTVQHIENKSDYYVGIGRAETYWRDANLQIETIPFILPALTGMAQSNGLPENFKQLKTYGYPDYHKFGIDSVNCKTIPGKKIINFLPNQAHIYPCP